MLPFAVCVCVRGKGGVTWFTLWSRFPKKCDSMYQHYVCIERKLCHCKKTSRRHGIILYYNVKHIVHDDIVNIKLDMEEIQRM